MYLILGLILFAYSTDCQRFKSKFFPEYGVLIEPEGSLVSYDSSVNIILSYQFIVPKSIQPTRCIKEALNFETFFNNTIISRINWLESTVEFQKGNIYEGFCENLLDLCQIKTQFGGDKNPNSTRIPPKTPRSRRWVQALAGGMGAAGTAMSLYDLYTSKVNQNEIEALKKKLESLQSTTGQVLRSMHQVHTYQHNMFSKISNSHDLIYRTLHQQLCREMMGDNYSTLMAISSWVDLEIQGLMNMLNGELDPTIISLDLVEEILKSNDLLQNSVYQFKKGLLIQTSQSYLLDYKRDEGTYIFLLDIPLIQVHMTSPLYRVYNGGWIHDKLIHKLNLPESFYLYSGDEDQDYHAISLRSRACRKRLSLNICDNSKHFFSEDVTCLNTLLRPQHNITCDVIVENPTGHTEIYKTESGVMILGPSVVIKINSVSKHLQYTTEVDTGNNHTKFIPYDTFKSIQVNGFVIVSRGNISNVVIVKKDIPVSSLKDTTYARNLLKSVDKIKISTINDQLKDDDFYPYFTPYIENTFNYIELFVLIIAAINLCVTYYLYKQIIKMRHRFNRLIKVTVSNNRII